MEREFRQWNGPDLQRFCLRQHSNFDRNHLRHWRVWSRAYIQANYFGAFTASLELFDVNYQSLGIYTTTGTADTNVGTALFIGAFDLSGMPDVYAAQFTAYGIGPAEPDFSIGSLGLATVPEPSSLLLLGTSVLGLAGYVRRRFKGVL